VIRDAACGADEEMVGKTFEPFFSTKFVGRVIGLAAVPSFGRWHNDTILLDTEPGKAAAFRILLPVSNEG